MDAVRSGLYVAALQQLLRRPLGERICPGPKVPLHTLSVKHHALPHWEGMASACVTLEYYSIS